MIYDYRCEDCEKEAVVITTVELRDKERWCGCGGKLTRILSTPHFTMGAAASRFDDHNARQKAWIDTPEVQAKLKTGEYAVGKPKS